MKDKVSLKGVIRKSMLRARKFDSDSFFFPLIRNILFGDTILLKLQFFFFALNKVVLHVFLIGFFDLIYLVHILKTLSFLRSLEVLEVDIVSEISLLPDLADSSRFFAFWKLLISCREGRLWTFDRIDDLDTFKADNLIIVSLD